MAVVLTWKLAFPGQFDFSVACVVTTLMKLDLSKSVLSDGFPSPKPFGRRTLSVKRNGEWKSSILSDLSKLC